MVKDRTLVSCIGASRNTWGSIVKAFINENPSAWWSHWMGIPVIIVDVNLVVCGLGRIHVQCAQDVEGDDWLSGHMVPKLDRPITSSCAEATDEVVLECLDGPFNGIHTVVCWFHELPSASLLFWVFFDGSCGLVVHHINCRLYAFSFGSANTWSNALIMEPSLTSLNGMATM